MTDIILQNGTDKEDSNDYHKTSLQLNVVILDLG